jgi:methionine synthase II (cobalamin-independent)
MVTTVALGSWPPPFGLRPRLRPFWRGEVGEDDGAVVTALTAAARIAMDEMLACELEEIAGGEVFAPDFVHTVPPRLGGLEAIAARDVAAGQRGVGRYRITGPVTAPDGLGHARAFRRESAIEPSLRRASVPSPFTIAISFPDDPQLDAAMDDLIAIVRSEVQDLAAAGATEIQVDAPAESIAAAHGARPADQLARWIAEPFEGLAAGVTRSVHFCLGDIARKPSTQVQNLRSLVPVAEALDGRVARILLECSYAGQWAERDLLARFPPSLRIVAGIGDVKSTPAPVEDYAQRIDALLEVIGGDRLGVSASCGSGRMPPDDAITLNRNLVKAARLAG